MQHQKQEIKEDGKFIEKCFNETANKETKFWEILMNNGERCFDFSGKCLFM